jgi:hypothetical protein
MTNTPYIGTYDYKSNGDPETFKRKYSKPEITTKLSVVLRNINNLHQKYGVIGADNKIIYNALSLEEDFSRYVSFLDNTMHYLLNELSQNKYPALKIESGQKGAINPSYVLKQHLEKDGENHPYYDTFLLRQKKLANDDIKLSMSYTDKNEPNYFILAPVANETISDITKTVNIEEIADILSNIESSPAPIIVKESAPYSLPADTVEDLEKTIGHLGNKSYKPKKF